MQEVSTESPHMITSGLPQQDYQIAMYWWWPAGRLTIAMCILEHSCCYVYAYDVCNFRPRSSASYW